MNRDAPIAEEGIMKAQRIDAAKSSYLVYRVFHNGRFSAKRKGHGSAGVMKPLLAVVCRTLALVGVLSSIQALPAWAASRNVDGANLACSDVTGTPYCAIQPAIDAASPGDTINVAPGTYSETATVPSPPACANDTVGLFIGVGKAGLTIQGVDSANVPITSAAGVQATINTNSNLCFGPDGIFVLGDNVTIAGVRVGTNTGGQNKTIEVGGDNFTLKNCDIADLQGSVYFNDFNFDTVNTVSHLQRYRIDGNIFEDGVSLDITSGAGFSGSVSGRVVTGNTFKNLATTAGSQAWPSISFNGADTGVPWFVYSVGGAVITGNTFNNSAPDGQQIRARGTYNNTQFDWATYFAGNTFNHSVVFGAAPPANLGTFSVPNSYGTFNNVRRIGASIQGEVDHAGAGDTITVGAGTYPEQVKITTNNITINGGGAVVKPSSVVSGTDQGSPCSGGTGTAIVLVSGVSGVTLSNLNVDGSLAGTAGGPPRFEGIFYRNASGAIHGGTVANVAENPFSGNGNGNGILVQANGSNAAHVDIASVTVTGYNKNGVTFNGCGCADAPNGVASGSLVGSTITGAGPTLVLAQNAVQVGFGAGPVTITDNKLTGNFYTGNTANGNGADGVLFFSASNNTATGNIIDGNNNGIEMAFNQFGLCPTGDATGNVATCNRITNNDVGVLSYAAGNSAHSNAIEGNTVGADGSGIASGTLDATNNYWGCGHGANAPGCDTAASNVNVVPVLSTVPACVSCVSAAECDDGEVCDGVETCNTGTGMCQAGTSLPDTDGDLTCDATDNCPAVFNFGQSDGNGDGAGDICDSTETLPAPLTLSRVRLTSSSKPNKATIRVTGVFDPSEVGGDLAEGLALGGGVAVAGGGLSAEETMVFRGPRCVQLGKTRFTCIGTRAEVLKLLRKHSGVYSVTVSASNRSFQAPLSTAGVQVTLTLGGLDRRDTIVSCKSPGKHATATCRK